MNTNESNDNITTRTTTDIYIYTHTHTHKHTHTHTQREKEKLSENRATTVTDIHRPIHITLGLLSANFSKEFYLPNSRILLSQHTCKIQRCCSQPLKKSKTSMTGRKMKKSREVGQR